MSRSTTNSSIRRCNAPKALLYQLDAGTQLEVSARDAFLRPVCSKPCNDSATSCASYTPTRSSSSSSSSSWEPLTDSSTAPSSRTSTPSPLASWDNLTFSEKSNVLPNEQNGNWRTSTLYNLTHPVDAAASINDSLRWQHIHNTFANAAESAYEGVQDSLNRAFEGRDLPAMHDRVISLVPSVSMPSMLQRNRSVDVLTDSAWALGSRRSKAAFLDEELAGDHLTFAHHMAVKVRHALVAQNICHAWQVLPTRASMHWQSKLDAALAQLFTKEKKSFSVEQLFAMKPVWNGDLASKTWRLELDTGLVDVVDEAEGGMFEEKIVCLATGFGLPEHCGCLRIEDVQRGVVTEGNWMAVDS